MRRQKIQMISNTALARVLIGSLKARKTQLENTCIGDLNPKLVKEWQRLKQWEKEMNKLN